MGAKPSKKKSFEQPALAPMQEQMQESCCGGGGGPLFVGDHSRQLPTQCVRVVEYDDVDPEAKPVVDADAEAAAVIITVHTGGSYDKMFRKVPQEGAPGQRIAVYEAGYGALADIVRLVTDDAAGPNDATPRTAPAGALAQLAADVAVVEA